MKRLFFLLFIYLLSLNLHSQVDYTYFFSRDIPLDNKLLKPGQISGHTFGEWHFSHDQLINYMKYLSNSSDKVKMIEYGRTYENRPLYHLIISSEKNIENLDKIRNDHLDFVLSEKKTITNDSIPIIIWLGHSVHGNESSGANASMLTAYYLLASKDEATRDILERSIIVIDPCLNPDGFNRAASWVNMHQSDQWIGDLSSIQFNESWPGGRTNHYWFDLNRDWLLAQHPESKSRLIQYHQWKPAIVTDHHEMGSNGTFFFQPGVPSRNNPLTPAENYNLTYKIGTYHADALDKIGSLYFSEEIFDDFYYGKGSSYPDVNGAIGILFEQARVSGQVSNNSHGITTFAEAIRNQFVVSLSTIESAVENKDLFQNYQQAFYTKVRELALNDKIKGFAFGSKDDPVRVHHFLKVLNYHQIDIYKNKEKLQINSESYDPNEAYIVPLEQNQYRLIKSMFEKNNEFEDSVFYDLSTWTFPLSFNLDYTELSDLKRYRGNQVLSFELADGSVSSKSKIGYLFSWNNYNSPKLLYELLSFGINAKVATKPLQIELKDQVMDFSYGSIFIPVSKQNVSADQIFDIIQASAKESGVKVYGLENGFRYSGMHLGSRYFVPVKKPKILMVTGEGISSRQAGEIWHLLDQRMEMPITRVHLNDLNRVELFDYNTIIIPGGDISLNESFAAKLEIWIKNGGHVIALGNSAQILKEHGWIDFKTRPMASPDSAIRIKYGNREDSWRQNRINGVILNAQIDATHPICYGYTSDHLPVFKNNNFVIEKDKSPYSSPVYVPDNLLLSGYLNKKSKDHLKNSVYVMNSSLGEGGIIVFADNPNFRGYWYGTNKLFMNSIFWAKLIR